ncbi:ComEA family DNA-binding protein [Coralloluteibacterium stylophorae]|uniref:Helix-hairpin-helix domain-containing protein n=1 Tax=Coralloluteibacterium stylophorae TaxID=1776034 RepID=A0A8J7VU74_9GAMM|nr:helix-hairpin-helix domain-containing protein [Coralloluteibacterium stylophorae]MBS7456720.1 helix-hairpin-helix domain-containing protein [Coralloluteibacterium stylophorae]
MHKLALALKALALAALLSLPAFAATTVDINTADAAAIAEGLVGVGEAKAKAIVAYREANGPFKSADQLANVKGIGLATIEKNRDRIAVGGTRAPATGAAAGD